MGLDKKYISRETIHKMSHKNYIEFFNYFDSQIIIILDSFSSDIFKQINKCKIDDKKKILKIMKKCK